jgi:lactoylglutathione lyase
MSVSEIHHVAVIVADLERSADFYAQALGWRRTLRSDVGGELVERSLHLGAGVTGRVQYLQGPTQLGQLELIEWSDGPGPPPRTGYAPLGPFLLSFQVGHDELRDVYDRVVAMGAETLSEPVVSVLENYGPIGAFCFRDPDGNLLEIVALPSREEIKALRECQRPT